MACTWWLVILSPACAQSVRIAVAGDPSLANLIDVTTGELSNQPQLSVLDRADLDKLGQEQEIQSVLDSKDFSPVHLLPADGLVLLRAVTSDGKTGVFARLVAVQPGVILREFPLPDEADPLAQAQALAQEFAPYWPKLGAIQKGKITALSLLGLRFEVDAPETRDLERSMNLQLASRLSAEPDVLVLERWRLNDALFEKSLSPQQPSPFWTGSSLIDGSMKWQKESNRIEVALRLRPPQGREVTVSDHDIVDNLSALVGRLADKIQHHPNAQSVWNRTAEASHFSELGKWCLDNGLTEEGAEAIESALALGDNTRTTHMLQVKAYAMEAYPESLRGVFTHWDNYRADAIAPDSLVQRVSAAQLAAHLMVEYLKTNHDFTTPLWSPEDPVDLGGPALYNCLRLLRAAYENGFQENHTAEMADLRHEIQKLIAGMDERLLSKPDVRLLTWPKAHRQQDYLHHRIFHAGLWHDTPEETTAFYRENLGPKWDGLGLHDALFESSIVRAPYLDGEGTPYRLFDSNPRYTGPPWIVAWDGRSADQVKALWQNFLNGLSVDPDPVLQCDAIKFEFASARTIEGRNAVLARFVTFLQAHAGSLSQARGPAFASGLDPLLYWATQQSEDSCRDFANIYIAAFKQHGDLPPSWIRDMSRLQYYKGSAEVTPGLLAALDDYSQWYGAQNPQDHKILDALAEAHQTIYRAKPQLKPDSATGPEQPPSLAVTRFWQIPSPETATSSGLYSRPLFVDQRTLTTTENKIWFMTHRSPYQIFCVDPGTLQVVTSLSIPEQLAPPRSGIRLNIHSLDVSPPWLAVALEDRVLLYSRNNNQWQALDIPPFLYKPRFVNRELYLLYSPVPIPGTINTSNDGSGLIRVSLPSVAIENVISSRRIPPQTALDGKPLGEPLDLWLTPAGLTLAVRADHYPFIAYATPVGKNAWSLFTRIHARCQIRLSAGGALIGAGKTKDFFGQMSFIGASGNTLLLANPDDAANYPPSDPLWNLPEELRSPPSAGIEQISPIMRGDDLVLYDHLQNGMADGNEASLYYFAKGSKDGVRIPLAFDIATMKSSHAGRLQTPILNYGSLQATDYGLVIYGLADAGFWVIPWTDIDTYRARATPAAAAAAVSANPDE
ncbi:MAG TPA: hypothetical protein VGC39_07670 [Candidatus Methylacidiphilales bacterium]